MKMDLIEIHLRDLFLVEPDLSRIGTDHIAGVSPCRHAIEIRILYGLEDIRPDMQALCERNDIYARTFAGNAQLISI